MVRRERGGSARAHGDCEGVEPLGSTTLIAVTDPISGIAFRWLLVGVSLLELIIAGFCFFNKDKWLSTLLVAWLATKFLVYRSGLWWIGWKRPCSCMGSLTSALRISEQTADNIMKVGLVPSLFSL